MTFEFPKKIFYKWLDDKSPKLAAALAYYTVFSLAPIFIIITAIIGLLYGKEAAQGQLSTQIQNFFGSQGAQVIETMVAKTGEETSHGVFATVIGVATLLFGASGVFGELQDSLNMIWGVRPKPNQGIKGFVRDRFMSFSMILGVGFLLLVSLTLSAALSAAVKFLPAPDAAVGAVAQVVNFLLSFAVISTLFAMIFKILPDAEVSWRDVWLGAMLTSLLFVIGKSVIGLYIGRSSFSSVYGAAGTFVVLLAWVYYSSQILFMGAEFTQVYATERGKGVTPSVHAEVVPKTIEVPPDLPSAPKIK